MYVCVHVHMCVCICVCVCVRERERERDSVRQCVCFLLTEHIFIGLMFDIWTKFSIQSTYYSTQG